MNRRARPDRGFGLESLESRLALAGDFPSIDRPFVAYFPEGFASERINEFVPITNSGDNDVLYELYARYEDGEPGQLIAGGVLAAHTRGGVTVSDSQAGGSQGVRSGVPYALVLRASGRLSAMFSHYDFGTALGESFSEVTDRNWIIPEVGRDASGHNAQDFILVYNPDDRDVDVRITLINDQGLTREFTREVGAMRRAGWAINDLPGLPPGLWSAVLDADGPIVASASIYRPNEARGYGVLGIPGDGYTAGVIGSIGFDDNFYDRNGDDRTHPRFPADAFVSIFNPGSFEARVVISLLPENGGPVVDQHVVTVEARSRLTVSLHEFELDPGTYTAVYLSDNPVAVTGSVFQGQDGTGSEAGPVAWTVWDFGEGYMSRSRGGSGVIENLRLFNPGDDPVTVQIEFSFVDGSFVFSPIAPVLAGSALIINIDEIAEVRDRAEDVWFGMRVVASAPIVVSMEHWDSGNGGGFLSLGMPSGNSAQVGTLLDRDIFDPPQRPAMAGPSESAADRVLGGIATVVRRGGFEEPRIALWQTDAGREDGVLLRVDGPGFSPVMIPLIENG